MATKKATDAHPDAGLIQAGYEAEVKGLYKTKLQWDQ
jgi:hypothetical protein